MQKPIKFKSNPVPLLPVYNASHAFEIGIDEAGRGPLFGRVYVAAVILPKELDKFHHEWMRDSKQIKNRNTMQALATYIKEHALYWSVKYGEADEIDRDNILACTINKMHECVNEIAEKTSLANGFLLVDGNYFKPYIKYNSVSETFESINHETFEKGDGRFSAIAAASILAKNERDTWIEQLCEQYPVLKTVYSLDTNMGYGTKTHMNAIATYGITKWHRTSFVPCKNKPLIQLNNL
jgi:ribonuclease HII